MNLYVLKNFNNKKRKTIIEEILLYLLVYKYILF